MKKNLTLLIPMYNKSKYIERMVESLSEQTYIEQTKIIVTDDCSTDGSFEELERCANLYGVPMEVFFNEKNLGLARTILKLYRKIETPFWAVLDPDDYYIDPQRLERAVKFLEANPDCSMHSCNYVEMYPDQKAFLIFPKSQSDFSMDTIEGMPFPQTSAMVYRNFWTDELLNEMQRLTGDKKFFFTQADDFRDFCAIHFGKFHFENFLGSVWTKHAGIWDTLSELEKNIIDMCSQTNMVYFSRAIFHNRISEVECLKISARSYYNAVDSLTKTMKNLSSLEFRASKYLVEAIGAKTNDITIAIQAILDQQKFFKDRGVSFD